jgi:hypothetical protein
MRGMDPDPDSDDEAAPEAEEGDEADEIDPREAARIRRRDHDAAAHDRDLLRPGMGKVFKQIQDGWARSPSRPPKLGRAPRKPG